MTEWIIKVPTQPEGWREVAAEFDRAVAEASAASMAAMELALAMVWHCLDCLDWDLREIVDRIETHHDVDAFGWRGVVVDGRVIHRQRWEQVSDYTWTLRQEWCP